VAGWKSVGIEHKRKGWTIMDFSPLRIWDDGNTMLNSAEDRAGALLIAIFGAILSFWIIPEALKRYGSHE
jgi:hypothetical protein